MSEKILILLDYPRPGKLDPYNTSIASAEQRLFVQLLLSANINPSDCTILTVFLHPPKGEDIKHWCISKKQALKIDPEYSFAPLGIGKYLHPKYCGLLQLTKEKIRQLNPNVVIAFGDIATLATLNNTAINSIRGVIQLTPDLPDIKIIPTYHPLTVQAQYSLRVIVHADLQKAKTESAIRGYEPPPVKINIPETLDEVLSCTEKALSHPTLACDIETAGTPRQITCIGFSSLSESWVFPFVDLTKPSGSYWDDAETETKVWKAVEKILASPCITKIGQNFNYDLQHLMKMGLTIRNASEDTMYQHHSLFCELPKGLDFLASIYTSFPSWKHMRKVSQQQKAED